MNVCAAALRRGRLALAALALTVVAGAAIPVASADSPLLSSSVGSGGQTTACANNQQSSVSPNVTGLGSQLALNTGSCTPSFAPTSTSAPTPSSGGSSDTSSSSTTTATNATSTTTTKASTKTSATGTKAKSSKSSTSSSSSASNRSVAAWKAHGVRIAAIHYGTLKAHSRLSALVTLRDLRRHLIRGAIVTLSGIPGAKSTLGRTRITFTNRLGLASFALPMTNAMAGQRLLLKITARTPSAMVFAIGSRMLTRSKTHR